MRMHLLEATSEEAADTTHLHAELTWLLDHEKQVSIFDTTGVPLWTGIQGYHLWHSASAH